MTRGIARRLWLVPAILIFLLPAAQVHARSGSTHPVSVPPGWPKMLIIPKIGLQAPVEYIAYTKAADYEAPYKWGDVAWFDKSPRPGEMGHSAVFGHLDSYCCPAAFYGLRLLHRNDVVQVVYKNGRRLTFYVDWRVNYPNTRFPTGWVFSPSRDRGLVLITCTGVFHRDGTGYDHKMVVYARMATHGQ